MSAQASFPEIMQHMGLNYTDYATLIAPILFEMHSNSPIKKTKFMLDKKKRFIKAELALPRPHAHCQTISCSPLLTQKSCPEKNIQLLGHSRCASAEELCIHLLATGSK